MFWLFQRLATHDEVGGVRITLLKVIFAFSMTVNKDAMPTCSQCGYDLRGIDSKNCPECGLPFYTFKATFHDPVGPRSVKPQESKWWLALFWVTAVVAWLVTSFFLSLIFNSFDSPDKVHYVSSDEAFLIDFFVVTIILGIPILIISVAVTLLELSPKAASCTLGCTILFAIGAGAVDATYHVGLAALVFTEVLAAIGGVGVGICIQSGINRKTR